MGAIKDKGRFASSLQFRSYCEICLTHPTVIRPVVPVANLRRAVTSLFVTFLCNPKIKHSFAISHFSANLNAKHGRFPQCVWMFDGGVTNISSATFFLPSRPNPTVEMVQLVPISFLVKVSNQNNNRRPSGSLSLANSDYLNSTLVDGIFISHQ